MRINRIFLLHIVAILLCTVESVAQQQQIRAQDFSKTYPLTYEAYGSEKYDNQGLYCSMMPKDWIAQMNDPILDSLISYARVYSNNIIQALDRIMQSKAALIQARSNFYPNLSVNAGWNRGRETSLLQYSSTASIYASTSWEIDLFGSIRKRVKSQSDLYKVSVEDYKWVMLSMCAEVAQSYISLRSLQQQMIVDEQNAEAQKKVFELTQARYNAGLASKLDVLQAQSVYLSTMAIIPQLRTQIVQSINSISILLSADPDTIKGMLEIPAQVPQFNMFADSLCTEVPIDLIINRPDIKAAEYSVNSYAAALGATKADWWPKFYFAGSVGFSNDGFGKIFRNDRNIFTINPTITWTLFSGRQLQATTAAAKAELDQAVNNYNQTVLTAIADVENTFSQYYAYKEQIALYKKLVADGRKELELALELYKKGLQNFQTVLDVLRSLLSYESSLVIAKTNITSSIISVYKNLSPNYYYYAK